MLSIEKPGMKVKCPRCGKEVSFKHNPYRPFCSERCKLVDLGKWVTESYRVPTVSYDEDEDGLSEGATESSKS